MKKATILLLAISALAISCKDKDRESITLAAHGYLDAMANYKINEATAFCTEETKSTYIAFLNEFFVPQYDTSTILRANCAAEMPATITIQDIEISNDTTAVVTYTKTTPRQISKDQTLKMRKRSGEWYAHWVMEHTPREFEMTRDTLKIEEVRKSRTFHIGSPDSLQSKSRRK
ncbi:MAG: hypothetical protein MJZ81_02660 [Bacteroidales bacterium]|nr:hypothetical protein [Bacteroidales bacterium]